MPRKINEWLICEWPRILLIQEDSEAEAGEGSDGGQFAGADGGVAETATGDHSAQVGGQMVEIGGLEARDGCRLRAERGVVLFATPARVFDAATRCEAIDLQKTRHLLFLFLARKRRDDGGEILRSVILFAAALDGHADGIHLWIEDVGTVRRGVHPRDV